MNDFTRSHFLFLFLVFFSAVGMSVSCGDKDDDKPKPKVMTVEAQQAAIQEAVTNALPVQLMAPPAMMGPNGFLCEGEIVMDDVDRGPLRVRYMHTCRPK